MLMIDLLFFNEMKASQNGAASKPTGNPFEGASSTGNLKLFFCTQCKIVMHVEACT